MADRTAPEAPSTEPRAPSTEVWRTLTVEQRARVIATLEPIPTEAMPPIGDPHIDAERLAESAVGGWLRRRGRRAYLGRSITVYYPDEPRFAPDFFVVFDVPEGQRMTWVVDHEGRGLDFVLEIHYGGDRKKDLERNVEWFARLGIPEYFVFDARARHIYGWQRGEHGRYVPIVPQAGRWRAAHLGAELGLREGRLRFYVDGALLPIADEIEAELSAAMNDAMRRAEDEARRAEDEARRAEDEARRAEEDARRAEEEAHRAEALALRVAALEAELARLRAERDGG